MAIIEVKGLTTQYHDNVILDDISFNINENDIFVISGPSGCGKTTLLNHLIGLLKPIKGEILINGHNLASAQDNERRLILKDIGVMYQSGALFSSMTLIENVMLPMEELTDLPEDAREAIAMSKLQLVNLANDAYKYPSEISGGMNKRAAIARALALDPRVIFLDEPSAGLDPTTTYAIDQLLLELAKTMGITFVMVTHEVPSILAIANNMILLHHKKIVEQGHPKDLRHSNEAFTKEFFEKGLGYEQTC